MRSDIIRFFSFSNIPPLLSHFFVFLTTIAVVFDIMQISVAPIKVPRKTVLFSVAVKEVFLDGSEKYGEKLNLYKLNSNRKIACVWPDVKAAIFQMEGQHILSMRRSDYGNYIDVTSNDLFAWSKPDLSFPKCRGAWEVDYG